MLTIIKKIRNSILCKQYKKKYSVIINGNPKVHANTVFEGKNVVGNNARITNSIIGKGTYIGDGSVLEKVKIGKYCSIAQNICQAIGNHPTVGFITTHPAFFSTRKQAGFTYVDKNYYDEISYTDESERYVNEIGNDVWMGANVLLLNGVKIGNGAIIAAGAVVAKDVEPYAIVGGVPAKLIRYRFEKDKIEELENSKWWEWDDMKIKENIEWFRNCETE